MSGRNRLVNRWQGAKARVSGRELEAAVEAVNAWYNTRGEALVERVHLPTEGFGDSLRISKRSTVDFTGTAMLRGKQVPVRFDAKKVTGSATFKVPARDWHQLEYLRGARDAHGCRAFYLLFCDTLQTVWVLEDLDRLWKGAAVRIRSTERGSGIYRHHLPSMSVGPLAAAAMLTTTGRPRMDYLRLLAL